VKIALLVAALASAAQGQDIHALVGAHFDARVVRVADGDTVELTPLGQTQPIRIRFQGVDAPEVGEAFSREAQAFIHALLLNQHVTVDGKDVDRYGRLVARVGAGGKDASLELVKAGLACHRYAADPMLARAEAQARAAGLGFWAANATKPQCVAAEEERQSGAPARSFEPRLPAHPVHGPLHGNVSTHLYHTEACPNFSCRNCTRVFSSEAEAQAAGFRPAGDCANPRP
jgi:endonuclease YncB( thermonuclease family)